MTTDYLRLMTDLTNAAYETSQRWADINTHTLNQLTQQQMAAVESGIEQGFRMARRAMQVKDYHGLIAIQTEMALEISARAAEQSRKSLRALRVSRDALAELLQKSVEQSTSTLKLSEVTKAA